MKALISRILFKNKSKRKFIASRLSASQIGETVLFNDRDITWDHCIVCHDPFYLAIYSTEGLADSGTVSITRKGQISAEVKVKRKDSLASVRIYEVVSARCHQLPYWHQFVLQRRYFLYKKKDTFLRGMIYAAMYSFPRRVIAVSYRDDQYFNIFPMDFQCFVATEKMMILGLRTTNATLKKILESKKVVVSDTTSVDLTTVYDLGRNHSAAPPSLAELPFGVIESKVFGFYVPDFSASYREFEIVNSVELGTHTLMIGSLVNSEKITSDQSSIHHLHFFEFVNSDYSELT